MTENDVTLWKWVSGFFFTALAFVAKHSWKASARVTAMKAEHVATGKRLAALEVELESVPSKVHSLRVDVDALGVRVKEHETRCSSLQKELAAGLTTSLNTAFESMLSASALASSKELGEINKNLALIAQSHEKLEEQVNRISDKVDRRFVFNPNDNGMRRRASDTIS